MVAPNHTNLTTDPEEEWTYRGRTGIKCTHTSDIYNKQLKDKLARHLLSKTIFWGRVKQPE